MKDITLIIAKIDNLSANKDILNNLEDKYIVLQIRQGWLTNLYTINHLGIDKLYFSYGEILDYQIAKSNRGIYINSKRVPKIEIEISKEYSFIEINTVEELKAYSQLYNIDYIGVSTLNKSVSDLKDLKALTIQKYSNLYKTFSKSKIDKAKKKIKITLQKNIENTLKWYHILDTILDMANGMTDSNTRTICLTKILDSLNGDCPYNIYYGDIAIEYGICILCICRLQMKGISKTLDVIQAYNQVNEIAQKIIQEEKI